MLNLFRPKTMRRMAVFTALLAPIVYLFGTMFNALSGAHGEQVFAEPVYVDEWLEVDSFVEDGSDYKYVVERSEFHDYLVSLTAYGSTQSCSFVLQGVSYSGYQSPTSAGTSLKYFTGIKTGGGSQIFGYINESNNDVVVVPMPWEFIFDSFLPFLDLEHGSLYKLISVPTDFVPQNNSAYTDFLFGNFFMKDNFLVKWGLDAISENPHGFAPFGYFWRYLDSNVLHLSNEQVGLMAYGYMYYAAHVLLFDVGFMLVTFFLSFIQKVGDKIGGEER